MRFHAHGLLQEYDDGTKISQYKRNRGEYGILGKKEETFKCKGTSAAKLKMSLCNTDQTEDRNLTPLQLKPFYKLFMVFAAGIGLGTFSFILELLIGMQQRYPKFSIYAMFNI